VPLVLDASIAASWFFEDEGSPIADRALGLVQQGGGIVPVHWWFELRNAFLVGERRKRLTSSQTAEALAFINDLPIEYLPLGNDTAIFALARQHRLSFYDAVYLEAAQQGDLVLATLDQELAHAARREGVPLVATY
jgi:predicted nucleic acid-binding protein